MCPKGVFLKKVFASFFWHKKISSYRIDKFIWSKLRANILAAVFFQYIDDF